MPSIQTTQAALQFLSAKTNTAIDRLDGEFFRSFADVERCVYCKSSEMGSLDPESVVGKVLIIRDDDNPFTAVELERFSECKHIFCQNNTVASNRVTSIPIGMEARSWCSFDKFAALQDERSKPNCAPSRLVYGNFSLRTNRRDRLKCAKAFMNCTAFTNDVVEATPYAPTLTETDYRSFCRKILDHLFVLCPVGNGIDTHRFWETLWLGRIPVVLHNPVVDAFDNLPVLKLDAWSDFEKSYASFLDVLPTTVIDYCPLTKAYWTDKINQSLCME